MPSGIWMKVMGNRKIRQPDFNIFLLYLLSVPQQ